MSFGAGVQVPTDPFPVADHLECYSNTGPRLQFNDIVVALCSTGTEMYFALKFGSNGGVGLYEVSIDFKCRDSEDCGDITELIRDDASEEQDVTLVQGTGGGIFHALVTGTDRAVRPLCCAVLCLMSTFQIYGPAKNGLELLVTIGHNDITSVPPNIVFDRYQLDDIVLGTPTPSQPVQLNFTLAAATGGVSVSALVLSDSGHGLPSAGLSSTAGATGDGSGRLYWGKHAKRSFHSASLQALLSSAITPSSVLRGDGSLSVLATNPGRVPLLSIPLTNFGYRLRSRVSATIRFYPGKSGARAQQQIHEEPSRHGSHRLGRYYWNTGCWCTVRQQWKCVPSQF